MKYIVAILDAFPYVNRQTGREIYDFIQARLVAEKLAHELNKTIVPVRIENINDIKEDGVVQGKCRWPSTMPDSFFPFHYKNELINCPSLIIKSNEDLDTKIALLIKGIYAGQIIVDEHKNLIVQAYDVIEINKDTIGKIIPIWLNYLPKTVSRILSQKLCETYCDDYQEFNKKFAEWKEKYYERIYSKSLSSLCNTIKDCNLFYWPSRIFNFQEFVIQRYSILEKLADEEDNDDSFYYELSLDSASENILSSKSGR